jgi:hypothetical protein
MKGHIINERGISMRMIYIFSGVLIVVALALWSLAARADTAQVAPIGNVGDAHATRIEVMVTGRNPPPKPEDLPKPGSANPALDPLLNVGSKATQDAVARAVKLNADLSTQWPACHFRIASIAAPEGDVLALDPARAVVRVTIFGESGCLVSAK